MSREVWVEAAITQVCSVVFAAALVALVPSAALSATCSSIEAELASLRNASASSGGGKWQTARSQQEQAISAAERDARYFRCSSAPGSAKCQGLVAKIERMHKNLRAIDRKISQQSGGGNRSAKRIRQLEQMRQTQNCGAVAARTDNASSSGGFFAKILDGSRSHGESDSNVQYRTLPNGLVVQAPRTNLISARSGDQQLALLNSQAGLSGKRMTRRSQIPSGGTFRTLCVRTCDGYFFPVSFSTGRDQFADDAARCGEICPAAPTELFVHRNPGGLQEEMVSLQGVPYLETENAYRFQTEFVPECTCRQSRTAEGNGSAMTPVALSGELAPGPDGRFRVSLAPVGPSPFFQDDKADRYGWSRTPMRPDQLPEGADPASRHDLVEGFNADLEELPMQEPTIAETSETTVHQSGITPGITQEGPNAGIASGPSEDPVFAKADDGGFRPRSDSGSIRVVGPEYFVAQ
ncbi:DUF2865 domain-containing protein [Roseibium sp.]|uniref:DUF2865 domain-containing protein n=1 Tax=Roseibium sp. TaxID=1936156 RepID=UPI003A9753A8